MLTSVMLMHIRLLVMMAKELLKLAGDSKLARLSFTANMLIETNNAPATFHYPMQVM